MLRLGAGVRVGKGERPAGIAAAVRRVLDQPAYARAARRFAATLAPEAARHTDGVQEAETLLTPDRPQR
jgi:UDP:flavonoid glycosyltransferase YjiC (YdhE family)